jgi:hypothetical protein
VLAGVLLLATKTVRHTEMYSLIDFRLLVLIACMMSFGVAMEKTGTDVYLSPAGQRLTVLFDPGRIKRGLVPNVEAGLPLVPGRSYRLVISADWLDAHRRPLDRGFEKSFSVTASDFNSPAPPAWQIEAPAAGSRRPLVVTLDEPIDQALGLRLIDVIGTGQKVVSGEPALDERETRWSFTPAEDWAAGRYRLRVEGTLEDPSGNSVLRPFEVIPGEPEDVAGPAVSYFNFEVR